MAKEKCVVILSGGVDSTVLLHSLYMSQKYDINCISFDYGQRIKNELKLAQQNCNDLKVPHKIVNLDFFKQLTSSSLINKSIDVPTAKEDLGNAQPVTYVPNRNMIFLSIGVGCAEDIQATTVFYGAQAADIHSGYWDTSNQFLKRFNNILALNRKNKIKVEAPFMNLDKKEIIKIGIDNEVNFKLTQTCYNGEDVACGQCVSCANRIKAFIDNGYIDPISYSIDIPWHDYACDVL